MEGELQANGTLFSEPLTVQAEGGEAKGLLRYCYIPSGSTVPICQDCLFEEQIPHPIFTSKRYGQPGYAQLSHLCAAEIRTGVGNIAEIGVFHHLYQPQREANIQTILKEYLPLGLDAGVFHVTWGREAGGEWRVAGISFRFYR